MYLFDESFNNEPISNPLNQECTCIAKAYKNKQKENNIENIIFMKKYIFLIKLKVNKM
jgi:hypothetical protein